MATSQLSRTIQDLRRAALSQDGGGLTDGQLLDCFIECRDETAFAALVRRHGPVIWGVCRRVLSHHDAEDAFQATFLVLARKAASVRQRETVVNWLYGVAYRTAWAARRANARRGTKEKQVKDMPQPPVALEETWHSLQPLLDQELYGLPDKFRLPVILCDLEGKTGKEAARQLKIPEGTLASRLRTARMMLAKRLAGHGRMLSGGALAAVLSQNAASACAPAAVVSSTIQAAPLFAAGQAAVTSIISAKVAALTDGVVKAMFITKLKAVMAVVVLLGILAFGGGLLTQHTAVPQPGHVEKAEAQRTASDTPEKKAVPKKEDKDLIQGTWKVKQADANGKHQPKEVSTDQTWMIADGKIVVQYEDGTKDEWAFKLDPAAAPRAIDVKAATGFRADSTAVGIYELKSATLRVCVSWSDPASRPTAFDVGEDRGGRLFVLQRVAEPKAAKPGADTGKPIRSLAGHKDRVTSVAYSPDGQSIATAAWDGTIRLWDPKSGKEERRLDVPAPRDYNPAHLSRILFSPDNEYVVVAQQAAPNEAGVMVWKRRTGEKVHEFPGGTGSVAVSPDGSLIACGGFGVIRLYDLTSGKAIREIRGQGTHTHSLTFSHDGKTLASTGPLPRPDRGDGLRRLGFDPDVIRIWDVTTGKELSSTLKKLELVVELSNCVALSPDGRTLAVGTSLTEIATGGHRAGLTGHTHGVCAVAFSPDGRTLASGSMDGTVRLWDLPSGKEIGRFGKEVGPSKEDYKKEGRWVLAIAFSPDGRTLVSGGLDVAKGGAIPSTANIWDVSRITGRPRISAERSPANLEADWKDLAGDAKAGYAALGRLISSPERGVPFLGKQLESAKPVDTKRIEQLIADLNDGRFQVRERATKELEALAENAAPALRKALAGGPSLETSRRLGALLDRLDGASLLAETVRQIRAVEALESIGNPEARRVLDKLAAGPAETRLTQEAKASAGRLAKRAAVAP